MAFCRADRSCSEGVRSSSRLAAGSFSQSSRGVGAGTERRTGGLPLGGTVPASILCFSCSSFRGLTGMPINGRPCLVFGAFNSRCALASCTCVTRTGLGPLMYCFNESANGRSESLPHLNSIRRCCSALHLGFSTAPFRFTVVCIDGCPVGASEVL